MVVFDCINELKQLKRPRHPEHGMWLLVVNPNASTCHRFRKGDDSWSILDLAPGYVRLTSVVYLTNITLSREVFYEVFRPFAWTKGRRPGRESATIWPWASER